MPLYLLMEVLMQPLSPVAKVLMPLVLLVEVSMPLDLVEEVLMPLFLEVDQIFFSSY